MSSPTLADPPPETAPDDDVPELDGGPEAPESGKIELPRRGPSLVTRAVGLLMPVAILAGGVVGFMALASLREPPAAKEIVAPVALVETVPVGTAKKSFDIVTTGSVVPFREITVAAEVDGRIVERGENLRAGRFVEKGELLARIDPTDFRLAVKQWEQEKAQAGNLVAELRTNVANAQAALDVAREALELRDRDVDRLRRLEGRARTARDVDDALLARTTTKTSVVELESKLRELESSRPRLEQAVELADARLEQARADLQRTELRAPAAGVIVESTVEQDNFVRRGDPIAILDDVSAVEVRCPLEDVEVAWVRAHPPSGWRPDGGIDDAYRLPPVPATVTYDVLGNTYAWSAELCRIEGLGADRATRTV
ncbi:MAG: HlyD family efflux transporter periplasmic adaptor subunit, partial [Planctomycetota bacterium]